MRRLPIPAFMADWPLGLVPWRITLLEHCVRLGYVRPDGERFHTDLRPMGEGLDIAAGSTANEPALLARFERGVAGRLKASEGAGDWVRRALAIHTGKSTAHRVLTALEGGEIPEVGSPFEAALFVEHVARGEPLRALALDSEAFPVWATALRDGLLGRRASALASLESSAESEAARLRAIGELLVALGAPERAAPVLARAAHLGASIRQLDALARVAVDAGDRTLAGDAAERAAALAEGEELLGVAERFVDAGEFEKGREVLERQGGAVALVRAAELALWARDVDGARRWADDAPGPTAQRVLGAAALLEGDPETAVSHLNEALAGNENDVEARLWRAQAHLDLGALGAARDDVHADVAFADRVPWQLLRSLIELTIDARHVDEPTAFIHRALLLDFFGDEARAAFGDREATRALLRRALARLGGHRGERPTEVDPLRWSSIESPRTKCVTLQLALLRGDDPDEVLARFDRLRTEYPDNHFPAVYAGEIELWLGRYEAAFARFDAAWRSTGTRWAYVGSGAALALLGRREEALARWSEGADAMAWLPAEATYAYRGEVYRELGRRALARADLERAVASMSTRIGAWVSLARLELDEGNEEAARHALEPITQISPALVYEAARAAGVASNPRGAELEPLLVEAQQMMRGNCSSWLHSFIVGDELRILTTPHAEHFRRAAQALRVMASDVCIEILLR